VNDCECFEEYVEDICWVCQVELYRLEKAQQLINKIKQQLDELKKENE
jgi:hypothetical protein